MRNVRNTVKTASVLILVIGAEGYIKSDSVNCQHFPGSADKDHIYDLETGSRSRILSSGMNFVSSMFFSTYAMSDGSGSGSESS